MITKCSKCPYKFTFMDDDKRFTAIGCLKHGVLLKVNKISEYGGLLLHKKVINKLPCEEIIKAEELIEKFEHPTMQNVVDKEIALLAIKEAYKEGIINGQK